MLLKLDVQLRTLTLPALGTIAQKAQTPRNARKIEAQLTLIRNRMQNYRRSLASLLDKQVKQLSKGAQEIAYNIVLMQKKIGRLQDAVKALTKRKSCKRRYIQVEETLIVSKVSNRITKKKSSSCKKSETAAKRVRAKRRYGRCSKIRHNSRTYKVEIRDIDNSDTSK